MHECQEIRSVNINQKEDRFLIYERDLKLWELSKALLAASFA
jgi:hypothetical protein